jgi:predicted amidohydrolase
MRIASAQLSPFKGNVDKNIAAHLRWIEKAASEGADAIFFPELSITGYEPELAAELAMTTDDKRLEAFQQRSDSKGISIGVGVPTRASAGVEITIIVFQPLRDRVAYSKQMLHADELPYFKPGNKQVIVTIKHQRIAPAICYESLQMEHAVDAMQLGADIYLASVAKSQNGVDKAVKHYPLVAQKFNVPILMSNAVGVCDNFVAAGQSGVWSKEGKLLGQLSSTDEGLLIFEMETGAYKKVFSNAVVKDI